MRKGQKILAYLSQQWNYRNVRIDDENFTVYLIGFLDTVSDEELEKILIDPPADDPFVIKQHTK
jgi:hypothetical protein